jgi:anti-sigma-K factor RskA
MSGIIESYVLGLASAEERAEFEKYCRVYPELVAARTAFEVALEKRLLNDAVPGADLKEKVMNAIRQQSPVNQTKIITMQSSNSRSSSPLKWIAAASVILLIGAAIWGYQLYSENQDLKSQNESLSKSNNTDSIIRANDSIAKLTELMQDPNVAVVNLSGTEKAPESTASIYWDSTNANVYLVVKNMPKLPNDKQYQLWSLINGQDGKLQPSSLGLFDVGDDKKLILKMNNAQKADAFAITIENRGNTGGPSLEQLQNMGKTRL